MLVLSRKRGQTIVIDNKIRVTILNVRSRAARVGIDAPYDVSILREELESRGNAILPESGIRPRESADECQVAETGAFI